VADDTSIGDTTASPPGADIRTFLFADMRGYTRFTQQHGDHAASELAGRFADLVRDVVPAFEGELLELRGDEALSVFRSARQALRAAVEIQRRLRTADGDQPPFPLGVGMGLDAGEAIPTQGGYRGTPLNVAARLCGQAAPGQILATETVIALVARMEGMVFGAPRRLQVKGMADPVRAVDVQPEAALPPAPKPPSMPPRRQPRRLVGSTAVGVATAVVVMIALVLNSGSGKRTGSVGMHVRPNTVTVLNPVTRQVIRDIRVGPAPWAIAANYGAVWVANSGNGTVTRIDAKTMKTTTIGLGGTLEAIATGGGYVWAFDSDGGKVYQIDPHHQPYAQIDTYGLRACGESVGASFIYTGCPRGRIAAGYNRVWVGDGQGHVWDLNPNTRKWREVPGAYLPSRAVAVGNGLVYSTDAANVAAIDPTTLRSHVVQVIHTQFSGHPTLGIDPTSTALWVVSQDRGLVCQCDPGTLLPNQELSYEPFKSTLNAVVVGMDGSG
jgi:YVTN family beta-propeller protein